MENIDCLKIPGYDFWIEVDGKRAKQYQVKETNASGHNVVSCYIVSEVGKEFRIGIKNYENSSLTSIKLYLNDDRVSKSVYGHWGTREEFISHIYTSQNEKRKFTFTAIRFEEDEHTELTTIPQNLGTIRAEVFRVVNLRYKYSAPPRITTLNTPTLLSEKSKTAEGIAPLPALNPTHNGDGDRGEKGTVQHSEFHSKEGRKSAIRTIESENSTANGLNATSSKEPIIIENSDDDAKYIPNRATTTQCGNVKVEEHVSFSKRSGETLDPQARREKRIKKASDPVIIIIDSD
ncbi:hypothetical protein Clacol_006155 [Clathrus columnatus]|uniref:DUF7918 domain-containing protein n=1 Tax=Clathrus columnatus TaxID=1419009 RepID=A0AAV5ADX5_9AGAM|nr:hypothetical protein Clacol_006155 [Clathrus columnatus]